MYIIYIKMSNITTLADLHTDAETKPKKIKRNLWRDDANYYRQLNTSDVSVIPVPLKPQTKTPIKGVLFSQTANYNERDLWDMDKYDNYCMGKINKADHELGLLIKGNVAVIDYDDLDLFKSALEKYNLTPDKYIIYGDHKGGHIWFKPTDHFSTIGKRKTRCIRDGNTILPVDYLQHSTEGTPQIIRPTQGPNGKQFLSDDRITTLSPLPTAMIKDYETNWVYSKPVSDTDSIPNTGSHIRNLMDLIPSNCPMKTNVFQTLLIQYKEHGIPYPYIKEWAISLEWCGISPNYPNHTDTAIVWFNKQYDYISKQTLTTKNYNLIKKYTKQFAHANYSNYMTNYIFKGVNTYSPDYLKDINTFIDDYDDKKSLILKHYNASFGVVINNKSIMKLTRNRAGVINEHTEFSSKEFKEYCGVCVCVEEGVFVNSADLWLANVNPHISMEYIPYGITQSKCSQDGVYNLFGGYNMAYNKDIDYDEAKINGQLIHHHIKEVLCSGDMLVYNWFRKSFYRMLFFGERPPVAFAFYSPEKGSGKSMLFESMMEYVFGDNNCAKIVNLLGMLKDGKTDMIDNKMLHIVEELPKHSKQNADLWDTMKSRITDDKLVSRQMYKGFKQSTNVAWTIFITNHGDSLDDGAVERRIVCSQVSAHKINDGKYFSRLSKIGYAEWEAYTHYYLDKLKTEFNHIEVVASTDKIPKTKWYKRIMTKSCDTISRWLWEFLQYNRDNTQDDPYFAYRNKFIRLQDLFDNYNNYIRDNDCKKWITTPAQFKLELQKKFSGIKTNIMSTKLEKTGSKTKGEDIMSVKTSKGSVIKFGDKYLDTMIKLLEQVADPIKDEVIEVDDDELYDTNSHLDDWDEE